MSQTYAELMRLYADETAPTASELGQVQDEFAMQVVGSEDSALLLSRVQAPRPDEIGRVIAGVLEGRPERSRRPWGLMVAAAGGFSMAMAAVLVIGAGVLTGWWMSGDPPVAMSLVAVDEPAIHRPASGVVLVASGRGEVTGTESAPHIAWSTGAVDVEVEPDRGIALVVETREATVRVIGTAFDVTRDARGTEVTVERGRVHVQCHLGGAHVLGAGEEVTCVPTTAAGLLGRSVALEERDAAPEAVLSSVELGLAMGPSTMLEGELRAARVRALVSLERDREALDEVRILLENQANPRRLELLTVAATLAVNQGDCDLAKPWMDELAQSGRTPDLKALRRECR